METRADSNFLADVNFSIIIDDFSFWHDISSSSVDDFSNNSRNESFLQIFAKSHYVKMFKA